MVKNNEDKIDKLARMVARGFDETNIHFKRIDAQFSELRGEMVQLRNDIDIMLSRHIGTFRKDYDELAARVKRIEEAIFK